MLTSSNTCLMWTHPLLSTTPILSTISHSFISKETKSSQLLVRQRDICILDSSVKRMDFQEASGLFKCSLATFKQKWSWMSPPVVHIGHTITVRFIHLTCNWQTAFCGNTVGHRYPPDTALQCSCISRLWEVFQAFLFTTSPVFSFLPCPLSCLCCVSISLSPIMILSDSPPTPSFPPKKTFKQTHIHV